jgi:hypothetical protein
MWLFTKYGFFSVVCARAGTGGKHEPVDPNRVMVRARVRKHLESLVARFPELLEECTIRESTDTDYAFRLFVAKTNWVRIAAQLSDEIDYDNFKSAVARHQGAAGRNYESSLHEVWSVMHKLQK